MSTVVANKGPAGNPGEITVKLEFTRSLNYVTNKIHATSNIDEIMLEVSSDICQLFNADRLTIYSVGEDKQSIVSKVKTGLNSFKDLKLPIAEHSIAGYVALSRKLVNIKDVYDEAELKSLNPNLRFLQEVDKRTGYRTKQQLVAPIGVKTGPVDRLDIPDIFAMRDAPLRELLYHDAEKGKVDPAASEAALSASAAMAS